MPIKELKDTGELSHSLLCKVVPSRRSTTSGEERCSAFAKAVLLRRSRMNRIPAFGSFVVTINILISEVL